MESSYWIFFLGHNEDNFLKFWPVILKYVYIYIYLSMLKIIILSHYYVTKTTKTLLLILIYIYYLYYFIIYILLYYLYITLFSPVDVWGRGSGFHNPVVGPQFGGDGGVGGADEAGAVHALVVLEHLEGVLHRVQSDKGYTCVVFEKKCFFFFKRCFLFFEKKKSFISRFFFQKFLFGEFSLL